MTFDETLSGIRESIVRYAREGRLGLLGDSLTAYERVVAGEMLLRPAQPQENVEGQKTPTNSESVATTLSSKQLTDLVWVRACMQDLIRKLDGVLRS